VPSVLIRRQSKPKKTAWLLGFIFLFAGLQEIGITLGIPMHKKFPSQGCKNLTLDVHTGTQEDLLLSQDTDSREKRILWHGHTVQHQTLGSAEVCITANDHI
jgi:hypothetical protein